LQKLIIQNSIPVNKAFKVGVIASALKGWPQADMI
jgi:hypothetical protein